jgi:hypothetical protein
MRGFPRTPSLAPITPVSMVPEVFCSHMGRCPGLTNECDAFSVASSWTQVKSSRSGPRSSRAFRTDARTQIYDVAARIEQDQARELVDQSRRFIERMNKYLTSKGVVPSADAR